ncbi:MAG: hypothetical protein H6Q74_1589 [Firmicutes bacterium]|nr:hypothetical protein [Bacillota bacterium]
MSLVTAEQKKVAFELLSNGEYLLPGEEKQRQDDNQEDELDAIPWPDNLEEAAFYGVAGDVVKNIMPYSEADPAAVLINFLVGYGNLIGKTAYFTADREHYTNLFAMLVGASSTGKKGTSWSHVKKIFGQVDENWTAEKTPTGLSSGEGLIWAIRDQIVRTAVNKSTNELEETIEDAGVEDKRILLIESEFGRALKIMQREGNTTSATLRQAWDADTVLQSLTKTAKGKATNPHISIIGHITKEELLSLMQEVEILNGLGNRFIWVCCRKSKSLPFPEQIPEEKVNWLAGEISDSVEFAKSTSNIGMDDRVRNLWPVIYEELEKPKQGIVGVSLARGVPIVRRLAVIYALLDKSDIVREPHLTAALAVWQRVEQSARYIFGEKQIDAAQAKMEVSILDCLKSGEKSRTEISNYFHRKKSAKVINKALESLSAKGKVLYRQEEKKGVIKPVTYWKLA